MSVQLNYASQISWTETLSANVADVPTPSLTHTGHNTVQALNGSSSPVVAQGAQFTKAMSGGTATVDLTALTGSNGATVNGNGQKVVAVKISAPIGNGAAVTLQPGGSNPYNLFGASFLKVFQPGEETLCYLLATAPVIGSGAKNLSMTGTGTDALQFTILMG